MLILELLLIVLHAIGICLFMCNCVITNKFGAVGAFLIFIYAILQFSIRFI